MTNVSRFDRAASDAIARESLQPCNPFQVSKFPCRFGSSGAKGEVGAAFLDIGFIRWAGDLTEE
jgi:hypothetical protein